ncbi:hypothetical protein M9H77_34055 [Catharanthus roseus]|uniref:Uncharacterized protein n=1 Tax=Catharanthus roseus TaxID=4058 RepID=A0ACB9ZKE9_CATRO|nr:hypothetical protein M9H77_34055 [Catharanthus roseus]
MGRRPETIMQWQQQRCIFRWVLRLLIIHQFLFLTAHSAVKWQNPRENSVDFGTYPPVQLHQEDGHIVLENGIISVTLSTPGGMVTNIQYNGIDNLLLTENKEDNRGYWDIVWTQPDNPTNMIDKLDGTNFKVVMQDENQVEISFTRTFDPSLNERARLPLNIDKRFILLRGYPGFYSYAILERLEGWPDFDTYQGRIVFKLQENLFQFMAVGDERQRIMPTSEDRERGQVLDYKEAVLLTNPTNPFLKGEVDDKYQYSSDNKDNKVHGWICSNPPTGFWMITPSNEFKTAGPVKQDLTSHAGPTTLSMFFSTHYAGEIMGIRFRNGEPWKKVFGPVLVYLNSLSDNVEPLSLWADAKEQMLIETERWPYDFPVSEDYPTSSKRGTVSGRLLVHDRYVNERLMTGRSASIGLAPPGEVGSWQIENKGYQFWTEADEKGYFVIKNVREGNYSLYAWVSGFIGDYKYKAYINVNSGERITLGNLIYEPPRTGPTLWEIGIPDRTAREFYIPDPNPNLMNQLYTVNPQERFRQYGLWDRYTDLYPLQDLIFTVGVHDYQRDWFFAHVNRNVGNKTYVPTTWQIIFDLENTAESSKYTLQLALASANEAELQIRVNDPYVQIPHFTTGKIGRDNAIARHGIHGLYWLFSIEILGSQLSMGRNTIFLTQDRSSSPWKGLMYDYIRLEGPPL